jgi:hypothetical protein
MKDDGFRRAVDNTQNLAAAQGEQQNEIGRFLHGMSDQIEGARHATQTELAGILDDIGRLREQLKPKHVLGHVLPDGRVVLANGDVVDGVRGAPAPGMVALSPPLPQASHVKGTILPDGTVMAGGEVVDGVRGAMSTVPFEEIPPETLKELQQDRQLGTLADKGGSMA